METNTYAKPMYKCAICDEVYESIADRMHCEQTCLKKREAEEKKAEEAKKQAEYEARIAEVDAAFDHAYKLRDAFLRDYKSYSYAYHKLVKDNPYTLLAWAL